MKQRGVAYRRPDRYVDIVLPRNSFIGPFIGGAGFVFGFAMIWYIWWLAILSLAAIALAIIIRASDDDTYYTMSGGRGEGDRGCALRRAGQGAAPRPG